MEVCGEAENGKEAIEKIQELEPDLIIIDIAMPVLARWHRRSSRN
jgi:two-component system response regulator YesN